MPKLCPISIALISILASGLAFGQTASPNVNMVSGTSFPGGDPFLQRQNEPSIAVSSRNRLHLLGGSNDYRTVDLPGLPQGEPTGDAWLGIFKSFDNGETWTSNLIPGYPQDTTPDGLASPLKGFTAAADPTVRAGTNGLLFYSGIVFNRNATGSNKVFVARYVDDNNLEAGDPIRYLGITIAGSSAATDFLDKPSMAVDIPRSGSPMCSVPAPPRSDANKDPFVQFRGGAAYVAFTKFIGGPDSLNAQILVTHSVDCGVTWSTPLVVSTGQTTSQGAALAIDPSTGALYVTWRRFHNGVQSDAIMAALSSDGGLTFSQPSVIANIAPFDLGDNNFSFRTNGYPSIAIDGSSHAYIAWSDRTIYGARIRVAASKNSSQWYAPVYADLSVAPGHQFMPALSFTGGKLTLLYYDQRETATVGMYAPLVSGGPLIENRVVAPEIISPFSVNDYFNFYLSDALFTSTTTTPLPIRQTLDVRAAQAMPGVPLQFANSVRVSDFAFGSPFTNTMPGTVQPIEQLQYNPPNLPMFSGGTTPFMGDYIDLGSQTFIANSNGTWSYNLTDASASAHAVWTDNRDVIAPADGDWTHYTPVNSAANSGGASLFDPNSTVPGCMVGQGGARNQNIYTARISPTGLIVGSRGNAKQLGYIPGTNTLLQRAYPVTVENLTSIQRTYQLSITQQPVGGHASFLQFSSETTVTVTVPPHSTASRTVFATSTSPQASIVVTVLEIVTSGTPMTGSVVLNPDATNPNISNPNISNPNISNQEVYNPNISNPNISNPNISNPNISNYQLSNPNISNPNISNPNISNPNISNPNISNPNISNTNISNPNISNPNISNPNISNTSVSNASLSDTQWPITNTGNTSTAYSLTFQSTGTPLPGGVTAQLIVARPYNTPVASPSGTTAGCDLKEETHYSVVLNLPNVPVSTNTTDPQINNPNTPTVTLAPGETALIIIRIYNFNPPYDAPTSASTFFSPVAIAQGANTGTTTPPTSILTILNTTLAGGTTGVPYVQQMQGSGGTTPYQWFAFGAGTPTPKITFFGLPNGVNIDPNTGLLSGTPTQSGVFNVGFELMDSSQNFAFANLNMNIAAGPLAFVTPSPLPPEFRFSFYQQTIQVKGGSGNFTFAITGGALPAGLTMDQFGNISGSTTVAVGTYKFTVQVTDNVTLKTAKMNYTLAVVPGGA